MDEARVRGIRGAVTVLENNGLEIITATEQLLTVMARENDICSEDMVSIIFSVTADLNAAFPAEGGAPAGVEHGALDVHDGDPRGRLSGKVHPGADACLHKKGTVRGEARLPGRGCRFEAGSQSLKAPLKVS